MRHGKLQRRKVEAVGVEREPTRLYSAKAKIAVVRTSGLERQEAIRIREVGKHVAKNVVVQIL